MKVLLNKTFIVRKTAENVLPEVNFYLITEIKARILPVMITRKAVTPHSNTYTYGIATYLGVGSHRLQII